jgi:tetratricopeptide (TPR) repeat protein
MLNAASPDEAVAYFQRTLEEQPDRIDMKRGLAKASCAQGRAAEALPLWADIVADPRSTSEDRMEYADALIRNGDWDAAEAQLDLVPPTLESFERYRLEAMVADSNREWDRAESFYETAVGLTTRPAGVSEQLGFLAPDARRSCGRGGAVPRGDLLRSEPLHRQEQPRSRACGAGQLPAAPRAHDAGRARAASAHRRAGRDPAGTDQHRTQPVVRGDRHPSAAFRGRRARAPRRSNRTPETHGIRPARARGGEIRTLSRPLSRAPKHSPSCPASA